MSDRSVELPTPQAVPIVKKQRLPSDVKFRIGSTLNDIKDNFKTRLSEESLGINPRDVVKVLHTPEGGKVTFLYKQDFIARTIGHVMAIPFVHLPLLTFKDIFRNPSRELVDQLYDRWKDVPWKSDVVVRVGHTSITDDIIRTLSLDRKAWVGGDFKDIRDMANRSVLKWKLEDWKKLVKYVWSFDARLLFSIGLPSSSILTKFFRVDHYNPITKTVNIFHPNSAVGMHEMGHADFFDQLQKEPLKGAFYGFESGKIPFVRSFTEWKASVGAFRHMKTDKERKDATKLQEAAWGSYLVSDIADVVTPFIPEPIKSAFLFAPNFVGMIAGHILARLPYPGKRERFGYVFEGKKIDAERALGEDQMRVATASAPTA